MSRSDPERGSRPGFLIPIGGGEERTGSRTILRRFVQLSGGRDAQIVIIPTASKLDTTGPRCCRAFRELGVAKAVSLPFGKRCDCHREDWLETLVTATGIFMTGGSQLRLSRTLSGTPVARMLRRRHRAGVHIAGTSAGASYMSEHMIAFGDTGATPRTHMVALAPGIGLTSAFTIDQHFHERDRLGRLLTALAYNPCILGLGLDEDTAAFIGPDGKLEVVGSGLCTIADGSDLEHSSVGTKAGDPVCLIGVRLHILLQGSVYDIETRTAHPPPEDPDREVQET